MRRLAPLAVLPLVLSLAACGLLDDTREEYTFDYSFDTLTSQGWGVGVANYTVADSADVDFVGELRVLPDDVEDVSGAAYLASTSAGAETFAYLKQPVYGLVPGESYAVTFAIQLATDACGTSGEPALLKVGASTAEPDTVRAGDRFAFSLPLAAADSDNVHLLGDLAHGASCDASSGYRLFTRSSTREVVAEADAQGRLWIFVGAEASAAGRTSVYYDAIGVHVVGQ